MSIKVILPSNKTEASATPLFQWDYGQILEIEASDIGSEVCEVHFACSGMSEAIVRPCSFSAGVGTVPIPDQCLEQTTPITAWIYRIHDTNGYTWKAIKIPVVTRTRPSCNRDIPQEVTNRYTELITEVNEAVNALENGTVVAAEATHANTANSATSATNAANANHATEADQAKHATTADGDANGRSLVDCLRWDENGSGYKEYDETTDLLSSGLYAFRLVGDDHVVSLIADVYGGPTCKDCSSGLFALPSTSSQWISLLLTFSESERVAGKYAVKIRAFTGNAVGTWGGASRYTLYYKHLAGNYPLG